MALIFGQDRLPEDERWDSPPQRSYATSGKAWSRFLATARRLSASLIRFETCDSCHEPFSFGDRPQQYRIPTGDFLGEAPRYTYGGKAHQRCLREDGLPVNAIHAWPGYTAEAQAYEAATR